MDLSNIHPRDKKIHKPIENLYLGGRTMSLLEEEPIVDQENNIRFRNDCSKFLNYVSKLNSVFYSVTITLLQN